MPAVKRLPVVAAPPIGTSKTRGRLTVDDICEDLGISRRLYQWRAKGTAPKCLKLPNGELRIGRADYDRWLGACEDAA